MTRETLQALLDAEKSQPKRERPLSLRLSDQEHALLHEVAKGEGLPPATLARVLIIHGLQELEGRRKS